MQKPNQFISQSLNQLKDGELVVQLEKLVKSEKRIMHLVLAHIAEVESRKLYLNFGYDSMYRYLVQHFGYSEDEAYHRLQGARLLRKNPEITEKLEAGSLKLSQLVKVSSAMKQFYKNHYGQNQNANENNGIDGLANADDGGNDTRCDDNSYKNASDLKSIDTKNLFAKLENKTLFETERVLAQELNFTPKVQQKIKPQSDESIRLEITLTKEQYELLQKAQSMISHSVHDQSLAEAIAYLAESYVRKIEGKKHNSALGIENPKTYVGADKPAEKLVEKPETTTQGFRKKRENSLGRKRKYISVKLKRQVFAEADHCCEFFDPETDQRCCSTYQLQLDHIIPWRAGGKDTAGNLRVLCGAHNWGRGV